MSALDALLAPLTSPPTHNYLPELVSALRQAAGVPDRDRALIAQALEVGQNYIWSRSRWRDYRRVPFFMPVAASSNWRTFLPSDLSTDDAKILRDWASRSNNAAVRARLFGLLWERERQHADVVAAIDALLELQSLFLGDDDWVELVRSLGRAADLAMTVNDRSRTQAGVVAFEAAAQKILSGPHPHGFANLSAAYLAIFCRGRKDRRPTAVEDQRRWLAALEWLSIEQLERGELMTGEWGSEIVLDWYAALGDKVAEKAAADRQVEILLQRAEDGPKQFRSMVIERALAIAKERGSIFMPQVLAALHAAVRATAEALPGHHFDLPLDMELAGAVRDTAANAPSFAHCVAQLAVADALLAPPLETITAEADDMLKTSLWLRIADSVSYGDGKIRHRGRSEDEKREEAKGMIFAMYLAQVEALLHLVLADWANHNRSFEGMAAAARSPTLRPERVPFLETAASRFAAQDWISSGALVSVLYEALLRDELRVRCNYSALRSEPDGSQKDETLTAMLNEPTVRVALGEGHAAFVSYVLCQPHVGPNMRNEVAHGTVQQHDLTPTRVLLVWLFIVRLLLVPLVVKPVDHGSPAPARREDDEKTPDNAGNRGLFPEPAHGRQPVDRA